MSNENELVIKIDQTGADKTAQAIGKVTAATKENAKAVETQAKATKAASVDVGKFGSALGIAGNTVGQFNSTAGQMVSRLGAATGAIQSLSTMGLGPLGVAFAAVNIAVTTFNQLSNDSAAAMRSASSEAASAAVTIRDLASAYAQARDNAATLARVRAGEGTADEQRAALEIATSRTADIQRRIRQSSSGVGSLFTTEAERRSLYVQEAQALREEERLRDAQRRQRNEAVLEEESGFLNLSPQSPAAVAPARRGGGAARAAAGDGGAFANASSAKAKAEQALAEEQAFADAQAALEEEKTRRTIEAQKERDELAYEERMAAEEKVTRLLEEEEERRLRAAEETDRARVESYQTAARAIEAIGGTIAGVYDLVDSAGASADESAEARQKRELKRMAFMQAVEAIINAARSAAAFASQDYVGGAAFAAASGLNIAAAAKAGVDAGNVPRTSGASAGGGMSRDNASRGSGSQGAGTIVINMNGPVIAASDRAELGRQLGQIINEGAGRYGS